MSNLGFRCASCALLAALPLLSSIHLSAQAGPLPPPVWGNPTCAVSDSERASKHQLLQQSQQDPATLPAYQAMVRRHRDHLQQCRAQTWPQTQAVWLRLYAYDAQPGVLQDVFDRIVNRGYNRVFVEVFYDGRVLLPVARNPTPWRSVMQEAVAQGSVAADFDLWAASIEKARERGLEIYGWMFTLNFGYGYSERSDRTAVFARNGLGETSIANARFDAKLLANGKAFYEDAYETEHLFVDPYNTQARADLLSAVRAFVEPKPDGLLFDYVRYPTFLDGDRLVTQPQQLWIYGEASQRILLNRLPDPRAQDLMQRFLANGQITAADIEAVDREYAGEPPLFAVDPILSPYQRAERYQTYFWQEATDHAYAGVLDFLAAVIQPAQAEEIPVGTVFFPGGNRAEAEGFDARMQPWDRFPSEMQRHPMTYAICEDGVCVADQITRVRNQSLPRTLVCPILAGTWGQPFGGHASLEVQMQAIQQHHADLSCISHFVYSWMEPNSDQARKAGIGID